MQASKKTSKTMITITVREAELRQALGLDDAHELTSVIAEPALNDNSVVVLTFLRRDPMPAA